MSIRTWMTRTSLTIVTCLLLIGPAVRSEGHGITADHSVEAESLASFAGLTPPLVWQRIDGLDYWAIPLDPPSGYYAAVDDSSPNALRRALHALIVDHRVAPYSNRSRPGQAGHVVDTWDIIALADAHPIHPDRVLDVYLNGTFDRQLVGVTTDPRYDREHSWPTSLGFPTKTTQNPAYSDCHHLYAAYRSYNSSRSNKPYGATGEEPEANRRRPTLENLGRGGSLTDEPGSSNYSPRKTWQTWLGRRGDVARAMFYMDVRYDGDHPGEADLKLSDDAEAIKLRDVWNSGGEACMGLLQTLLRWHVDDPVDDLERRRNMVVYLFQGNRNPFIDHPEWVGVLFGDAASDDHPIEPSVPAVVWINELHYDNRGSDVDEFVELAGPADQDLGDWQIVAYNGNGGRVYNVLHLSGRIPNLQAGFGVAAFGFERLQNGPSDGLALVAPNGAVVQFISYEGRFTASDGVAEDRTADDIGHDETGLTAIGHSLQLRGTGNKYADFQWAEPAAASRGSVNAGQTLQSGN